MKLSSGLTLVELILAAVLSVVSVAAVISGYNFLFIQTKKGIGRGNLNLQIDYALEKIRLQCESASAVDKDFLFPGGANGRKAAFCITGEMDPYYIDIANKKNKSKYCYQRDNNGNLTLVAKKDTPGSNEIVEVLIDSRYSPYISFEYSLNNDPNYLTAVITATAVTARRIGSEDAPIVKKTGIRFGYTKIIK